ncbi:MAG: hypothetical protein ACLR0U_16985 [Enterocloster clostridioformis]
MIEASGYEWQIFGNGLYQDYLFELEVLEYVGKAKEVSRYLAGRPVEGRGIGGHDIRVQRGLLPAGFVMQML